MAQRLVQFRLVVWDLLGRKVATIFFRSTRSKACVKAECLLSNIYFEGGLGHYVLYQI